MVDGGVDIAEAINYDAEQLYEKLLSEKKQNQQQSQGSYGSGQQGQKTEQQDTGHDTHSLWEKAVKKHKEEQSRQDKKESILDKLFNRGQDKKEEKEKTELEKKQEELEQMGENDAFNKNREENKIIFTDGEATIPKKSIDAIWIVFGEVKINPKGGRVIHITPEQLDKLYSYDMNYESNGRSR